VAQPVSRARAWVDRQDPGSRRGAAIGVLPAVLVLEEYLDPHPNSPANSLVHHYRLNASTSELTHDVLGEGRPHELRW
jgi:hypothetical protein